MGEMLPWLIGAWILFWPRPRAAASSTSTPSPSQAPPPVAYLYRLPRDAYETTRVAVARQPRDAVDEAPAQEVGVFSSEADALRLLVNPNGWALAWPGVKQLDAPP